MKEKVRQILSCRDKKCIKDENRTSAAVLIPICEIGGEYCILFTKRTEKVVDHKGQVSFPGGAQDRADELLKVTALRESFEEIGIRSEDVEIIGELDDIVTISTNYVVSPFVAFIPYPYEFRLNTEEVENIIEVPLTALLDKSNFREETQFINGRAVPACFYYHKNWVIWGATARILKQLLDLLSP